MNVVVYNFAENIYVGQPKTHLLWQRVEYASKQQTKQNKSEKQQQNKTKTNRKAENMNLG